MAWRPAVTGNAGWRTGIYMTEHLHWFTEMQTLIHSTGSGDTSREPRSEPAESRLFGHRFESEDLLAEIRTSPEPGRGGLTSSTILTGDDALLSGTR